MYILRNEELVMKHYIVANKRQELDVLGKLEDEGFMWANSNKLPTEHTVSEFPHVIIADNKDKVIMWSAMRNGFPAESNMTLRFSEIEIILRDDVKKGNY